MSFKKKKVSLLSIVFENDWALAGVSTYLSWSDYLSIALSCKDARNALLSDSNLLALVRAMQSKDIYPNIIPRSPRLLYASAIVEESVSIPCFDEDVVKDFEIPPTVKALVSKEGILKIQSSAGSRFDDMICTGKTLKLNKLQVESVTIFAQIGRTFGTLERKPAMSSPTKILLSGDSSGDSMLIVPSSKGASTPVQSITPSAFDTKLIVPIPKGTSTGDSETKEIVPKTLMGTSPKKTSTVSKALKEAKEASFQERIIVEAFKWSIGLGIGRNLTTFIHPGFRFGAFRIDTPTRDFGSHDCAGPLAIGQLHLIRIHIRKLIQRSAVDFTSNDCIQTEVYIESSDGRSSSFFQQIAPEDFVEDFHDLDEKPLTSSWDKIVEADGSLRLCLRQKGFRNVEGDFLCASMFAFPGKHSQFPAAIALLKSAKDPTSRLALLAQLSRKSIGDFKATSYL